MITALDKFKTAAAMPVLATALAFNPATSQDAEAAVVTLDFEQFAAQTVGVSITTTSDFQEDGFDVEDSFDGVFSIAGDTNTGYLGEVALIANALADVIVTQSNSNNFDALSLMVSAQNPLTGLDVDFEIGGTDGNGQVFSQWFTTNSSGLQQITMNFNNISELWVRNGLLSTERVQVASFELNDVATMSNVPAPAAAYLFGSALIAAGSLRKYQQNYTPA